MYFSEKEGKVIRTFYVNLDSYARDEMVLKWDENDYIVATFDTCFEDENDYEMDEEGYEEFTSFAFTAIAVSGNPPVYITEDDGFLIDYHNFPKEILVGGKKIN